MMKTMKKGKGKELLHVDWAKEKYRVGDCVRLHPEQPGGDPYIAKIVEIVRGKSMPNLRVQWFYRPEDTSEQRKTFHGRNELYRSTHTDVVDLRSIMGRCHVGSIEEYLNIQEVGEHDYYWRFDYLPDKQMVANTPVSIYCVCGLPYNPDVTMLYCEGCKDWFHPRCVDLDEEACSTFENEFYFCPSCREEQQKLEPGTAAGGAAEEPLKGSGGDEPMETADGDRAAAATDGDDDDV